MQDEERLEESANKNLTKFNKDKFKVLYLGNTLQDSSTGWALLGWGRDLDVLVDNNLKMSEGCATAAKKANRILDYISKGIQQRKSCHCPTLCLSAHTCDTVLSCSPHYAKKM